MLHFPNILKQHKMLIMKETESLLLSSARRKDFVPREVASNRTRDPASYPSLCPIPRASFNPIVSIQLDIIIPDLITTLQRADCKSWIENKEQAAK